MYIFNGVALNAIAFSYGYFSYFCFFNIFQTSFYILQLIYQVIFSCTYSFHSLNMHQHDMIYYIRTLSIHSLDSHLYLSSFQRFYYYKRLHLICIYTYTFHAILCAPFHYFNICVFNNIRTTHFCIWITDIVTTTTAFTCFNTKRTKYRLITININIICLSCLIYFHF